MLKMEVLFEFGEGVGGRRMLMRLRVKLASFIDASLFADLVFIFHICILLSGLI